MTADKKHVEHVQYFWGDPLTAAGSQSNDGKAALINAYLAGDAGGSQANESVIAVRDIVDKTPAPPGVKAYVSGPAALVADEFAVGEKGHIKVTRAHIRRDRDHVVPRLPVDHHHADHGGDGRHPGGRRPGVVAVLGHLGIIPLSTYATNLLTLLTVAAATDYAIFLRLAATRRRGRRAWIARRRTSSCTEAPRT